MPPLNKLSKTCLSIAIINALTAPIAEAAVITVTKAGDGAVFGGCTLRDAIITHNTSTNTGNCIAVGSLFDFNKIEFDLPNPSTITLVSEPLQITYELLELVGPGNDALTIDASNVSGAININDAYGISIKDFTIDGGGIVISNTDTVELEGLDIKNNTTGGYGGGVFINSSTFVSINDSTISDNTAYVGGGVAILDSSPTVIRSSTISGNSVTSNIGRGGGVYIGAFADTERNLSIYDSTISSNTITGTGLGSGGGGGIFATDNSVINLFVERSTISNNFTNFSGGGVKTALDGENTFIDTTISDNTASGGGGLSLGKRSNSIINRSTISNNRADYGGGIWGNSFTLTNSTISSNTAISANSGNFAGGSAIFTRLSASEDSIVINQSTIVDNKGASAFSFRDNDGSLILEANSVISNNHLGNCSDDNDSISVGTFNWFDDESCGTLNSGDPLLGPLADNGGPTKTHAPAPGSGLIGSGLVSTCQSAEVLSDQRGVVRGSINFPSGTTSCFIGSVEGIVDPPDPTTFFVIPLGNGKLVTIPL